MGEIINCLIAFNEPPEFHSIEFDNAPTLVVPLNAGDAILTCSDGNTLVVERKTPSDFLNTLGNKKMQDRLFWQLSKCLKISRFCYLVIEGEFERSHNNKVKVSRSGKWIETGWNWDSLQGALLTVQEMGIGIVFTDNYKDALARLSKRNRSAVRVNPLRNTVDLGPGVAFLTSLPGIGIDRAMSLLQHYSTPALALVALTDMSDSSLPGVKRGIRDNIRGMLQLSDGQLLCAAGYPTHEYPLEIIWPTGNESWACVAGKWERNEDGIITAVYGTQDELRIAVDLAQAIKEKSDGN